jgi:poly-gamma-glutamate capsule biosynthesis protein CapA/YwtB (metallophosphatase superfamily)
MRTVRASDGRSRGLLWAAGVSLALILPSCGVISAGTPHAQERGTLVIHGTGDVSLDPSQIPAFRTNGYDWAWSGLGGLFRHDDLTVVNLECPATDVVDPEPKPFAFRCDPEALPAARSAGVDVVSQANNHSYDDGPAGLMDSLSTIRAAGLAAVGAGSDQADALRAASVQVNGWTIAVLGIDEVLDPVDEVAGPDKPGTAAGHDFALALRAVRHAASVSDLVVVTIHWGVELDPRPRAYQVHQAHRMIDAGADVIFGSHPHRIQPMERYRGRPIFYSLGNFVWPRLTPMTSASAVAEVTVTPDGAVTGRLLPVEIVSDGHPVLSPSPRPSTCTNRAALAPADVFERPPEPAAMLARERRGFAWRRRTRLPAFGTGSRSPRWGWLVRGVPSSWPPGARNACEPSPPAVPKRTSIWVASR